MDRTPSMYDLVKRKHDQTPTPEKRSSRSSGRKAEGQSEEEDDEDEDDDDDDDEDDDDDDEDDDDDGEGEEGKDYKGYQLRQRRPVTNRYIAPPLKTSSQGILLKSDFYMGSSSLSSVHSSP